MRHPDDPVLHAVLTENGTVHDALELMRRLERDKASWARDKITVGLTRAVHAIVLEQAGFPRELIREVQQELRDRRAQTGAIRP